MRAPYVRRQLSTPYRLMTQDERRLYNRDRERRRVMRDLGHEPTTEELRESWRRYSRSRQADPALRENDAARRRTYYQDNHVHAGGIRVNRKTYPPEVVAIAELIRETKTVLRDMKGKKT